MRRRVGSRVRENAILLRVLKNFTVAVGVENYLYYGYHLLYNSIICAL